MGRKGPDSTQGDPTDDGIIDYEDTLEVPQLSSKSSFMTYRACQVDEQY
jgi:hypothetical protein